MFRTACLPCAFSYEAKDAPLMSDSVMRIGLAIPPFSIFQLRRKRGTIVGAPDRPKSMNTWNITLGTSESTSLLRQRKIASSLMISRSEITAAIQWNKLRLYAALYPLSRIRKTLNSSSSLVLTLKLQ